ncbi:hypothetical protein RWH45_12450 [Microbacterium sp. KSW4-17]|uniref:Uncharacterized protein n=1 Tax=Microbacterium galbum TaxID=3075994 RepID=A0ABU3T9F3_9MICO|nr:hypothetical protein [Microbacterium sp. KSW4-17]MDU0368026.1 hypothetical protein [Microbacterium sp. KSW4-17]
MVRIRLESPAFQRDVDVDEAEPLVEVEGMTWARAGEIGGLPRYIPAAAG